ncbi:MAG: hypothetical protein ICV87_14725, partial [Gemmatimonadetes bacterium]|nr:hypothetical protein [Gemmatimonadota bacterium]
MRSPGTPFVRAGAALLASIALLSSCDNKGGPVAPAADPAVKRGGVDVRASRADAVMMVRTPSAEAGERGGTTLQLDAAV